MGNSAQRLRLFPFPAPGVHPEARMQSLRTLGRAHFDSRRVSRTGCLWHGLKRAPSGLRHGAGQAQPPWVPQAHSSIPVSPAPLPGWLHFTRPAPPPSPEAPPHSGVSHISAPDSSPCSFHLLPSLRQAAHFVVLLRVPLQAAGLEASPSLTFQVPQSVATAILSPSRQGRREKAPLFVRACLRNCVPACLREYGS